MNKIIMSKLIELQSQLRSLEYKMMPLASNGEAEEYERLCNEYNKLRRQIKEIEI